MKKLCSVIILLLVFVCTCQGTANDKKSKQDIVKANVSDTKEKSVADEDLKKTQKWLKGSGINVTRFLKIKIPSVYPLYFCHKSLQAVAIFAPLRKFIQLMLI